MFNSSDSFKSVVFDPKNGSFWGVFLTPPISRFFLHFSPKLSKTFVSRFLLNAWSLWTLLCRCYMSHTWVLSSSLIERRLRSLLAPSLNVSNSHVIFHIFHVHPSTLTRKTTSDPITPHFSFTRSSDPMHASSALQLTLGHAQTGGCTRSYFISWRSLPVVLDHIAFALVN